MSCSMVVEPFASHHEWLPSDADLHGVTVQGSKIFADCVSWHSTAVGCVRLSVCFHASFEPTDSLDAFLRTVHVRCILG